MRPSPLRRPLGVTFLALNLFTGLLLFSRLSPARAQDAPSYRILDGGEERTFVLATDEVSIAKKDQRELRKVAATSMPDLLQRAKTERTREKIASPASDVELVAYEEGRARDDHSRRYLTRKLLVEFPAGSDARKLAEALGLPVESVPSYAPHRAIVTVESSEAALQAMTTLRAQPSVSRVDVLLARKRQKKAVPNDPLFAQQWHLRNTTQGGGSLWIDVNAVPVWDSFRGSGITIGIVDDGVQYTHPDLSLNYNANIDVDYNGADSDAAPGNLAEDTHGTACAGIAGAQGNNGVGVAGVAWEATITGLRLIAAENTDADEGAAFSHQAGAIHIKSNSWGPPDTGYTTEAPGSLAADALLNAVTTGRSNLGTVFIFAAGNGLDVGDNSNYDGYANSPYVTAVSAVTDDGFQAWYSEPGANIAVCAPSSGGRKQQGTVTTDLVGSSGYNTGSTSGELFDTAYTNDFGGTSSACPAVAGVCALMLQANPNLGWRDVKEILIRTARRNHRADPDWITNGAGISFNHKYGAGIVDAEAAVTLAQNWINLGTLTSVSVPTGTVNTAIADAPAGGIVRTINVPTANLRVETVQLTVNITHAFRGDLEIVLTSPSGTSSVLAWPHEDGVDNFNWTFSTVRNWGENAAGNWTLAITDRVSGDTGMLVSATLKVLGSVASAPRIVVPTAPMLIAETNTPANSAADPGETVTFNLPMKNIGATNAANITATLLNIGGVTNASAAQSFGALDSGGSAVSRAFTFRAGGCNGHATKTIFKLEDQGVFIGYATAQIPLGAVSVASFTPTAPTKITIRDNNVALPSPSIVTASVQGKVQRVRATLTNLTHPHPGELTVFLGGPDSSNIALFTNATASAATRVSLTFDDAAPTLFPLASFPADGGGTFRPWDYFWIYDDWFSFTGEPAGDERGFTLGEFNGLNANGQWRLYVQDWVTGSSGSIDSWSLELTSVQCTDNILFAASSQSGDEAAGSALVTVCRTGGGEGSAAVNYATSAGTATAGTDYTEVSGTLTFLPGELSKTISIPIANDSVIEAGETVQMTLSSVTGSSTLGSQNTCLVTIASDDYAEIAVERAGGAELQDGGSITTFGQVGPGGVSAALSFVIRNTGNAPLTGVVVGKSGGESSDFVINAGSVGASLGAGASATFSVSFVPTLPGPRSTTLQIASSDPDENPFDISVSGIGLTALEDWRLLNFGVTTDSGNAANGADGDFDGLSNLLEFAVQSDPDAASASPLKLVLEGGNIEATYTRNKAAFQGGFAYAVEWSDTLQAGSWSTAGVVEVIVVEDALMQSVKATLPAGSGNARFVRLRVTGN